MRRFSHVLPPLLLCLLFVLSSTVSYLWNSQV
nr:MAG TPA: C4-dicarboxylate transport sensor protein [Inoviridae sp.]